MREIVHVQVGQCGNQIGACFWDTIFQEHGISPEGAPLRERNNMERPNVYFEETQERRYVPRSIMVDLEPGVLDQIRAGPYGKSFNPDNFIYGQNGAGNCWAKGHYTEGAEYVDVVTDSMRKVVERTDMLQGFQLCHSLGGGTGSGMGTLLLSKIKEEYPDKMLFTFSVLPSRTVSNAVVEPYNTVLAMNYLLECTDAAMCIDNETLHNIYTQNLKVQHPTYAQLNALVTRVMSGTTSSLRFAGQLNSDLRKMAVNLVPFPRAHFFVCGLAPLRSIASQNYSSKNSVAELGRELFSTRSLLAGCDPQHGRFLAASATFRGPNISTKQVESTMTELQSRNSHLFVPWIPNSIQTSICGVSELSGQTSATLIGNTTAIGEVFKRTQEQFSAMFRRKAFLSAYTTEGMDESEFSEAEGNILDLLDEYNQYEQTAEESMYAVDNKDKLMNEENSMMA